MNTPVDDRTVGDRASTISVQQFPVQLAPRGAGTVRCEHMSRREWQAGTAPCPTCGCTSLRRSATRRWERPLRWFTSLVPYRCLACRWRGWRPAVIVTSQSPAPPPERLSLAGEPPPRPKAGFRAVVRWRNIA